MNIQWKIVMGNDYFPCFKFCKLQTSRRGRSCAGPQVMFDIFFKVTMFANANEEVRSLEIRSRGLRAPCREAPPRCFSWFL